MIDAKKIKEKSWNLKLLYVEDDVVVRGSTLLILERFFHDIIIADNGKEGLSKFKDNQDIDIVITDINMPYLNGLEMAKQIKEINSDISIFIFSAHGETDYFTEAIQIGIDGYILKPLDLRQFLELLKKSVDKIVLQRENEEYKHYLEQKVKEQVDEIIKKQQELNLFNDDILTIFTHELKTPLNSILGYTEYILRAMKKELTASKINKIINLLEKIRANAVIQEEMIANILDAGKIKAGKIIPVKKEYNLSELVTPIIENYKGAYDKQVIVDIDSNIALTTDKKIFTMLFTNLYSNSLKYSKSIIKISLYADKEHSFILVVEDDGEGIADNQKEKIFDMFEQVDTDVLTREKKGTGVGLYTVKHFAKLCQMDIQVLDSNEFGGAKFVLSKRL
jgi:signal transduction histidine kinase